MRGAKGKRLMFDHDAFFGGGWKTVEEANKGLESFRRMTGNPVVVPPHTYKVALKAGIRADLMLKSRPIPIKWES